MKIHMKHILALLLFPFAVFSQNETHITSNDSDCQTLANFEMYPENNLSVSQNTSIRFIDYKPILVGNDKSILKIQVESDNLPDSLKIILLNATLLDNGLGYDLIAGDSIYTSTDSIQTHIFKQRQGIHSWHSNDIWHHC